MKKLLLVIFACFIVIGCNKNNKDQDIEIKKDQKVYTMQQSKINEIIDKLVEKYGDNYRDRIERCVNQTAYLWRDSDGDENSFSEFCLNNFVADSVELDALFDRISMNFESLYGYFNRIVLDLRAPIHLSNYNDTKIDELFAGYDPYANLQSDFYENKIAFYITLNFPHYSLSEKEELGKNWSEKEWAYARLGDLFAERIPAKILQKYSEVLSNSDNYISNYNIYMGYVVDENGQSEFSKDKVLISHWNLRDELKSCYSDKENGLKKMRIIYEIMLRIINQDIPKDVINDNKYTWNPFNNKTYKDNKEVKLEPENNVRFQHLLNSFKCNLEIDKYRQCNYIDEKFGNEFEMSQKNVEQMFKEFVSSPVVKEVAGIVKSRLGRDLEPFDIWYDGFKSRSNIKEDDISLKTRKLFSNTSDFQKYIPNILKKFGFTPDKANDIASKISVDASKGAGHAWGAEMKGDKAHLRTRIDSTGMDYKGYNIAVHELGHNVEQTISLYDVPYWFIKGVPNTAFTEAWAFAFQHNDLKLLDIKTSNTEKDEALSVLDKFWSTYEIMGVSLVDQEIWKWMYANPNCNAEELKHAVIDIAKNIWNQYYAPVFGVKDSPILAIYSHSIDNPLYLSAYPIGHIIEFQLNEYIKDKVLGEEMQRICKLGRLTPNIWMNKAVGNNVSGEVMINAAKNAIAVLKNN